MVYEIVLIMTWGRFNRLHYAPEGLPWPHRERALQLPYLQVREEKYREMRNKMAPTPLKRFRFTREERRWVDIEWVG